eukprot:4278407-Pyramimonas_sp.AAC.1
MAETLGVHGGAVGHADGGDKPRGGSTIVWGAASARDPGGFRRRGARERFWRRGGPGRSPTQAHSDVRAEPARLLRDPRGRH